MEVESIGELAVEGVAYDGAVHSFRVGGMYSELVGAAGFGVVGDAGSVSCCFMVFREWNIPLAPFARGSS